MTSLIQVKWPAKKSIIAATTTRSGGFSEPPYRSFNLGDHVGDNPNDVINNRQLLSDLLPHKQSVQWLNQVHGSEVVEINSPSGNLISADAAYTTKANVALAVLTADCLPILLVNKQATEIAAIHGGWRPLAANIIQHTLAKFSCDAQNIIAWLGPCIGNKAFIVGVEVKQQFTLIDQQLSSAFSLQANGKYLADLHCIAKHLLSQAGVTAISQLQECTVANSDKYFSYRRDGKTGRMASIICMLG